MMPLEHDQTFNATRGGSPATNALTSNKPENSSVIRPESPVIISSTSNVIRDDRIPEHDQQANQVRTSVLRESLRPVTLKFEDVTYTIKLGATEGNCFTSSEPKSTRTILNGVSGIVRPGELLAMLGPSGSGKTTLLTALAGRLPGKISGNITYNGQPFSSSMKRKTGFVTQDDVLYPHLTVIETLTFAALLRLPKKLTREEKTDQAELVIAELGLTRCRNSVVGSPLIRGISGGERKRVSIGQEMLVNPSLLLLDEPTSGLDSTTALRIMATLRGLARGGRTVITTIHQPSSRLYRMFDKVLVLSEGCPIYGGSTRPVIEYFASIGYIPGFDFVNPADFLLDLANGVAPETDQGEQQELHARSDHDDVQNSTKRSLISSYRKNLHPILKDEINQSFRDPVRVLGGPSPSRSSKRNLLSQLKTFCCRLVAGTVAHIGAHNIGHMTHVFGGYDNQWTTTWWMQFKVLLKRGLKERRHESYSGLRIFQVMSMSILSGLLWWHSKTSNLQDQVGLLFFFSIFWSFFPLFNAIFAFPQERPMLTRERSSGMYRLSSYYFARMAGDLPMELVLPTVFVTMSYWMGGLKPSFAPFVLTLLIVLFNVLVSQGLGLALGAILTDLKQATTLSSVIMLMFLLVGGYYIQQIPPFIDWLKYISFSHYCYKLLVGVQYTENEVYDCGMGVGCRVLDFPAIKYLGIHNFLCDVAALTVMLVGYRLLAYVALRMDNKPH